MLSAVPSIAHTHQRQHASPSPLRCLRPIGYSPSALRKVPKHELHPHLNPAKHWYANDYDNYKWFIMQQQLKRDDVCLCILTCRSSARSLAAKNYGFRCCLSSLRSLWILFGERNDACMAIFGHHRCRRFLRRWIFGFLGCSFLIDCSDGRWFRWYCGCCQ